MLGNLGRVKYLFAGLGMDKSGSEVEYDVDKE